LLYVDPPYVFDTRSLPRGATQPFAYRHEMTDEQHRALAECLHAAKGMVVLSGYASGLYAELFADWQRSTKETHGDGARDRTEVLWLNPACSLRLARGAPAEYPGSKATSLGGCTPKNAGASA
jgi:DNA adenine methylase